MFDFGQTQEGRLFMTMEYLDGMSLRDALQRGPLAPQRVDEDPDPVLRVARRAHAIGIIHRDIKPDNMFLLNMAGSPDFVKMLDFSVAKLLEGDRMKTQAGVVFGTPQYMSPEQGRGLPLDARSDLYALGVLAFEMLTGNVPFNDDNPMTVIQMHLHGAIPPMPESMPYSVQKIVRRAMEKDPARRYQSAGEMMQHCQQVFAELNSGGVSVGGGGVPRTMIARPAAVDAAAAGMPQQQHGRCSSRSSRCRRVAPAVAAAGQDDDRAAEPVRRAARRCTQGQQQQQQQGGLAPPEAASSRRRRCKRRSSPGWRRRSSAVRCRAAGQMPGRHAGHAGQATASMMPQDAHPAWMPGRARLGPNKTVLLQPTEGIVSVAQRGGRRCKRAADRKSNKARRRCSGSCRW